MPRLRFSSLTLGAILPLLFALNVLAGDLPTAGANLQKEHPTAALPRSTPEAQGVSSAGIRAFVEAADRQVNTMHSFMLVRHGQVIAEGWWKPEAADKPHVLHSLSKSFTSTAVGLAVEEGKLKLDDPVLKFFPEYAPAEPSENLKAMSVRDLLTMSCGHDVEVKFTESEPWVKTFLAHPVPFKPGTHFQYNTPGTHMLSAIVTKVTGQPVLDYLRPRLFEPLGIENPEWPASPQGNTLGGWGLRVRTEDIAKFGQLYLQKGKWNGKQLIPASWVEQATRKQVSNASEKDPDEQSDWQQGYGFQFWRCTHGFYRGDGANGQYCLVLPEQDAVLAITADTRDMQAELRVVWEILLPAFQKEKLPENAEEQARLKQTLAGLAVSTTAPLTNSKVLEDLSFPSAILKKDKKFTIYLPPDYETSKKSYPVLYLLHGKGDDSTAWVRKGNLQATMDACIVSGLTEPMIVVTPDAEVTFYMNQKEGNYPYEDFFFQELIPYIEKNYRCLADKKHRAVAGLSMGGFGSLLYSLHHPDMFQSCYAMSASVRTDEEIRKMPFKDFQDRYQAVLGDMKDGDERITDFWNKNSILHLVKNLPEDQKKAVRFFIDCGDDDFLTTGNSALHILLCETGVPHEYRVKNGAHTWDYWRAALPEALNFITQGMRETK